MIHTMRRTAEVIEEETPTYQSTSLMGKNAAYTPLLVVLVIIASFFLGMLTTKVQYLEKGGTTPTNQAQAGTTAGTGAPQPTSANAVIPKPGGLPVLGDANAKVTIVEFSDFQCPFCRSFWKDTLPQIKKEYIDTGKVKLAFRHYPLSFHPMAQKTAEGAECANDQDKFWEFHDVVYEKQDAQGQGTITYTNEDLATWAGEVGIDSAAFTTCLDSGKHASKITEDMSAGTAGLIDATPAFYVGDQLLVGAQPFSAFKAVIDQQLAN